MQTLLVINPCAGKGKAEKQADVICSKLSNANYQFDVKYSEYPTHSQLIASEAVKSGYDRIVAVGGDGTVNEVLNGILIADGDPEFGIIPAGSCNDFIKSADIPAQIENACDVLIAGKSKRFDVIRVGDRYCFNAAGVGFDVAVTKSIKRSRYLKGFVLYMVSVLGNLFQFTGLNLKLDIDGEKIIQRVLMLTVANGTCYGGDFRIAPPADATDGFLNTILINDLSPLKRISALANVLKGTHLDLPDVRMYMTKNLYMQADNKLTLQLDGELLEWDSNEIQLSVEPQRIKVIVP